MQLYLFGERTMRIDLQYARMAEGSHHDVKPGMEIFVVVEIVRVFIGEYKVAEG
jgi:hypothetical protein